MLGCLCRTLLGMWCKLLGGSAECPWKLFDVNFPYKNAQGLRKIVKLLAGYSGQVDFPASNFLFSLAQWPRALTHHLPSKK